MSFYIISKFRKLMNQRYYAIKKKLTEQLSPEVLEIRDDSYMHKNHGNIKEEDTETHFYIKIKSSFFNNKSKLSMHKLVYDILKEEFTKGLHALELDLSDNK